MLKKIVQTFSSIKIDWFLCGLISITLILCYQNYTPGTILSGWDTIHPEFNMQLYWTRILNVWQEHQGLGAPPSQSHAAEIPRMIIYSLLYIILPMNLVRYSFFWITIILGPIGVYYFIRYITHREKKAETIHKIGAFIGALFYLLNLGTVQQYIVILEMFAVKFAALGFIFLFLTRYLDLGRRKDLIYFAITIFFSASMAHTATLWYVFYVGFVGYTILYSLICVSKKIHSIKVNVKRASLVIGLTFILNAFWILPNLYYSFNYGDDVINSKIHRLFSEEAYLNNKDYGTIADLSLLKNFLFNWYIAKPQIDNSGKIVSVTHDDKLLDMWILHMDTPFIKIIAYGFMLLAISGCIIGSLRKNRIILTLTPLAVGCALLLLADTPGIREIIEFLRSKNSLLKEIFRFPFTKLSLYLVFCLSIFVGYQLSWILRKLQLFKINHQLLHLTSTIILTSLVIVYSFPAFQGQYISPIIRVKIPVDYFQMFQEFGHKDNERVLVLPFHSLYGWTTYQWPVDNQPWVYQGAGFTWFGLYQPTLNREFDRWFFPNEQAYREFFYALYSKDKTVFEKLLQKYNIKSILIDKNVNNPGDPEENKQFFYSEINSMMENINGITLHKNYGQNIQIFNYNNQNISDVNILKRYNTINPPFRVNYFDYAYLKNGNYISSPLNSKTNTSTNPLFEKAIVYPGRNILDSRERIQKDVMKLNQDNTYSIYPSISQESQNNLQSESLYESEYMIPASIFLQKGSKENTVYLRYLTPYFKNISLLEESFTVPAKINQLIIADELFDIASSSGQTKEYLGDILIHTDKTLTVEPLDANLTFDKKEISLQKLQTAFNIQVKEKELTGKIFQGKENSLDYDQIQGKAHNCSVNQNSFIEKNIIKDQAGKNIINYKSVDGRLCDTLNYRYVPLQSAYILAIESKNQSGLPIRLCVKEVSTTQCLLNDELSKNKDFATDFFILPPYTNQIGYDIAFENLSIGSTPSINQIKNIQLIPIPYQLLQSYAFIPQDYNEHNSNSSIVPKIKTTKYSPTFYKVNASNLSSEDVITLNQAYEKGWTAYIVKDQFQSIFPLIFGQKINDHVLVNNWENGWKIPEKNKHYTIIFVYTPQMLFNFGIILLITSFSFILKLHIVLKKLLQKIHL